MLTLLSERGNGGKVLTNCASFLPPIEFSGHTYASPKNRCVTVFRLVLRKQQIVLDDELQTILALDRHGDGKAISVLGSWFTVDFICH